MIIIVSNLNSKLIMSINVYLTFNSIFSFEISFRKLTRSFFPKSRDILTFSISSTQFEFAFKTSSITPSLNSLSLNLVIMEFSFVLGAIIEEVSSRSLFIVIQPISVIHGTISIILHAFAVLKAIFEPAHIHVAILINQSALSIHQIVIEFAAINLIRPFIPSGEPLLGAIFTDLANVTGAIFQLLLFEFFLKLRFSPLYLRFYKVNLKKVLSARLLLCQNGDKVIRGFVL